MHRLDDNKNHIIYQENILGINMVIIALFEMWDPVVKIL